jgi:hypothetical protein
MKRTIDQLASEIEAATSAFRREESSKVEPPTQLAKDFDAAYQSHDFGCHTSVISQVFRDLLKIFEGIDFEFYKRARSYLYYNDEPLPAFVLLEVLEDDGEYKSGTILISHCTCGRLRRSNGEPSGKYDGPYRIANEEAVKKFIEEIKQNPGAGKRLCEWYDSMPPLSPCVDEDENEDEDEDEYSENE